VEDEDTPQPPTKAAKLLAVLAFFMLLFFIAASVGLPLPVNLVAVFFVTAAIPLAFIAALCVAMLFRLFARATGRDGAWPFFDVALQTFIVCALLATGMFVVKFPGGVRGSYPGIRAKVDETIDPAVPPAAKQTFLEALDRFWELNVRFMLEEGEPPSSVAQQEMRDTISTFGEALAPDCPECEPKLSGAEVAALTAAMNRITLGARPVTAPTFPAAVTAAAAATGPTAVTASAAAVTSSAR
jgi:hypothetical protein